MVVIDLGAGSFQKPVMIEQLQTSKDLLRAGTNEGDDLLGTKKPMPMNHANNLTVAIRELHDGNASSAFETGKTDGLHPNILTYP